MKKRDIMSFAEKRNARVRFISQNTDRCIGYDSISSSMVILIALILVI